VRAIQEQRTGDVTRHGNPAGGYAGVPTVFLQHTRVRRGSFTREQENPRVRGEVDIANPFGSIVLLHDPRHPATSTLRHRRALLFANLVHHGNSLSVCCSPQPRFTLIH
jgi:hypothetical protein